MKLWFSLFQPDLKYYKLKISLKYIIVFLLFILNLPSEARETEIVKIEFGDSEKIIIKPVKKFLILNPEIIDVITENDGLQLKTKKKIGSTVLHVWSNKEIISYKIIVQSRPQLTMKTSQGNNFKNLNKFDYGYYSISSIAMLSEYQRNSENFLHDFYYSIPALQGNLSFKTNFYNKIENLTVIKNVYFDNISLKYSDKLFSLQAGDTSIFTGAPFGGLGNNNIRGLKFSYGRSQGNNLSLFSGFARQPLYLIYDKLPPIHPAFISGGSGYYSPSKNILLNSSFYSNISLVNSDLSLNNLSGGMKWDILKNFILKNTISTNFNGLALSSDTFYRHNWESSGEWADLRVSYNHADKQYLKSENRKLDSYNLNVRMKHSSGFILGSGYNYSDNGIYKSNNINFQLEKKINKIFNIYANTAFFNQEDNSTNQYNIGSQFSGLFPVGINYSLRHGLRPDPFYSQQVRLNTGILKNNFFSLSFNGSLFNDNIRSEDNNIKRNNNISLGLSSSLNLIRELTTSFSAYYNLSFLDLNIGESDKNLIFQLGNTYRLSPVNKFTFNLNYNIRNSQISNIQSLISYNYSFGKAVEIPVGDIKGSVFFDANNNGMFDQDEKTIPRIKINLKDRGSQFSDQQGFSFKKLEYDNYQVEIDTDSLPEIYRLTTAKNEIIKVDSATSELNFGLSDKANVKGYIFGNKKRSFGLGEVKILLDGESTVSDIDGTFSFKAKKGKHKIKIDTASIPAGYYLSSGEELEKTFEIDSINEDKTINFSFEAIRNLKITVFNDSKGLKKLNKSSKRLIGQEFFLKITAGDTISETKILTDEDGEFILKDLEEGSIEITSPLLTDSLVIEIPETPAELNIEIPVRTK